MIKRFYVEIDVPKYFKRGINCEDCPFSKGVYCDYICLLTYDDNKVDRDLIERFSYGSKERCPLKKE